MTTSAPPAPPLRDAHDLASFGYRQRLDRTLGGFSSFAAGFSYLSILTGLPQLFYLGFRAGGPAFFWSWPVVFAGQFLVALCFAEAAAIYPLSGGVYQWSKRLAGPAVGWLAGWVYLACATITLAAVALALQVTLPQISEWFQIIGTVDDPVAAARNAVLLGCILIGFSTIINSVGVRILARINNVGVAAEIVGALLLVVLLALQARRGPGVVMQTLDRGAGRPFGVLGPLLAAALVPSYVMYGFDTAGSLAEETTDPRRRAPRAILGALASVALIGACLIVGTLCAAPSIDDPALGTLSGGMPMVVKQVLGDRFGGLLLCDIALAVIVCTLTVHAAAVRLMFAMARDGNLPFAHALASVPARSRTPTRPALLLGAAAIALLIASVNNTQLFEGLVSISVVWANLAYLLVTAPLLVKRLQGGTLGKVARRPRHGFALGRWGLAVNLAAVLWGLFMIGNMAWPRPEVYGAIWYRRWSAVIATIALLGVGIVANRVARRRRPHDILEEHRAAVLTTTAAGPNANVDVGRSRD